MTPQLKLKIFVFFHCRNCGVPCNKLQSLRSVVMSPQHTCQKLSSCRPMWRCVWRSFSWRWSLQNASFQVTELLMYKLSLNLTRCKT